MSRESSSGNWKYWNNLRALKTASIFCSFAQAGVPLLTNNYYRGSSMEIKFGKYWSTGLVTSVYYKGSCPEDRSCIPGRYHKVEILARIPTILIKIEWFSQSLQTNASALSFHPS